MKVEAFVREKSRGNAQTIAAYLKAIAQFRGWLGPRPLTVEAVREYEAYLANRYRRNSIIPKCVGVNLFLEWSGVPSEGPGSYRMRMPTKEIAANPKLVMRDEYEALLARIADPAERLVVRLLHDSLLRPSDVVTLRRADLADEDGLLIIRKRTLKTGKVSESVLSKETADELKEYVTAKGVMDYLFPVKPGKPRHRTWPNVVLRKHGAEGVTPRTFRRTGATRWNEDLASLMAQGAWSDPKTILMHYRRDQRERHVRAFEQAIGKATDDEDGLPGYG